MTTLLRRSFLVLAVTSLTACGSSTDAGADLSPAALQGRQVVRTRGCAACHGANGDGGVGPSFVGLFGSEVDLRDGGSVTADRGYLIESITDPSAAVVDGYNLPMPRTELSENEIDSVISYIEALSEETP